MDQTTHFFNLGYGWLCKHCSAENTERKHHHEKALPLALAQWVDEEHRRGLMCRRCGVHEPLPDKPRISAINTGPSSNPC